MSTPPKPQTTPQQQMPGTITVPLSLAQWAGGGLLIALMGAGGGYVGSSGATSPDVLALQISQLESQVAELQTEVRGLNDSVRQGTADRYKRSEAERDLGDLEERLRRLERRHPELDDVH